MSDILRRWLKDLEVYTKGTEFEKVLSMVMCLICRTLFGVSLRALAGRRWHRRLIGEGFKKVEKELEVGCIKARILTVVMKMGS